MVTPEQMVAMQEKLDNDRAQLPRIRDRVRRRQQRLGRPPGEIATFTRAINRLIELDDYQRLGIGWAQGDPQGNQRYQEVRDSEATDRRTVLTTLQDVERRVAGSRHEESHRADLQLFASIPTQEQNLYRARRDWARSIADDTMEAIPFASNQISDIANSGGQSYDALEIVLDNRLRMPANTPTWIGQTAVLGAHAGAGSCDEMSAYTFTEANRRLPGTEVTLADLEPGHANVIVGPPLRPESVHIDTWPLRAGVTSPQNYGLDNIQTGSVVFSQTADGQDLRALAMETLRLPLPPAPPVRDGISLEEAMERMRLVGAEEETYHITSASTVRNSDSDSDDVQGYGHPLSRSAFTATLANGFQLQSETAAQSPTTWPPSSSSTAGMDNSSDMQYGAPTSYVSTASYASDSYGSSSSSTAWGTGQIQFSPTYSVQDVQYSNQAHRATNAHLAPTDMQNAAALNPTGMQGAAAYNPTGMPQGPTGSQRRQGASGAQQSQQSQRSSGQRRRGRGGGGR